MLPELEPKSVANEPKSHNQFKTSTTNLSYHQVYKCQVCPAQENPKSVGLLAVSHSLCFQSPCTTASNVSHSYSSLRSPSAANRLTAKSAFLLLLFL